MTDTIKVQPMDSFIQGQRDCRDHKEPDINGNDAYQSGFSFEYQLQQNQSAVAS
jgi:hypothetical protein